MFLEIANATLGQTIQIRKGLVTYLVKSSKEDLMKRAYDLGFNYTRDHGGCSQCVFEAVSEVLGVRSPEIFKTMDGLAGGLVRAGDGTCGALSGGVAAISQRYGRADFSNLGEREKGMVLGKRLHDRFIEEFGSVVCKDVQTRIIGRSFDLWDPKEHEEFNKAKGDKCQNVVGKTAKWTVEILLNEKQ
jgi:C_GCAxxG_C_C family probable redox protein